jgi:HEPN domain-containing protein
MHAETEAWIEKAEGDFIGASALAKNRSTKIGHLTSFASQQSAEKYLKAYLVEQNISFPKTHDRAYAFLGISRPLCCSISLPRRCCDVCRISPSVESSKGD